MKTIRLDIACGQHKDDGWVGIDIQQLAGVDIVHDLNVHPWPLKSDSVTEAKAWHIVEHIPPVAVTEAGTRRPFLEFMDECWRVLMVGARMDIETPYGSSSGFYHDPTHCNPCSELTFEHFDPDYRRFLTYRPKPWRLVSVRWDPESNLNVVLEKRAEAENG